jgi:hypothetical protein
MFDPIYSAYSYEDLPSDKYGADFGANYFDPNSNLTFGEQLEALKQEVVNKTVINVEDSLLSVFISFNYHVPDSAEVAAKKEIHELLHGSKRPFNSDSLTRGKEIFFHIKSGKIILM